MLPPVHLKNPTPEKFRDRFLQYLRYSGGIEMRHARAADHLTALELAVRESLIERAILTRRTYDDIHPKTVHYLSLEYLMGRLLRNNMIATDLLATAHEAMQLRVLNLDTIVEEEPDSGLGNGGLGRLAACFLDSLATLDYPAIGYGLNYDYGMFRQDFDQGWQVELADTWLEEGSPWQIERADLTVPVKIGGEIEWEQDERGKHHPVWRGWRTFFGVPRDVLVAGYDTLTVSTLRLWSAQAPEEFDFQIFSQGDYVTAVGERDRIEAITRVLYPADHIESGRMLRLLQEYFLVACSVRDVVNRFRNRHGEAWELFPDKVAFQLNDTHPALTIAELMRFFVDEADVKWAVAWELTKASCGYTNHTLLPEALETWPVPLMETMIPRHVQIIYEINRRFMVSAQKICADDPNRLRRMSILQQEGEKRFRMANLAIIGSHKVNGVAQLHTKLLRTRVVKDFADAWPERFIAITNGITPRRWLLACNPRLAAAITRRIGDGWATDLDRLSGLAEHAEDPEFQDEIWEIKRANKENLAALMEQQYGVPLDPRSIFDVHIKRLHEYKRQLLNIMHVIWLYQRIKVDPATDIQPRSFIFGAKAAPSYHMAKLIIRLINGVADVVNSDPDVAGRIRIAFPPDYRVTLAEKIIPAADVSEQISTAGMEASGTGNMKLALNGALTIGTLDGANIEIRDAVGADNIFIFGLTADQVEARHTSGSYKPWKIYRSDPELAAVIDAIHGGSFVNDDDAVLHEIWSALMEHGDRYMHLADFRSYVEAQEQAASLYTDRRAWTTATIRNIAAMGYFSSDRSIREYAAKIWDLEPVAVIAPSN